MADKKGGNYDGNRCIFDSVILRRNGEKRGGGIYGACNKSARHYLLQRPARHASLAGSAHPRNDPVHDLFRDCQY